MRKVLYFLPLFFFVIPALTRGNPVHANEPPWASTPKKDKVFFYSVGYVEDTGNLEDIKAKAFQNAKGFIADAIFEETSVEKVLTTSGGLGDNEELRKTYTETIKSKSAVNLTGVETEDIYYEKTEDSGLVVYKVWVLAKISYTDLERERSRILSELQRKMALVDDNLKEAEGFIGSGNIIAAVNSYLAAAVSAMNVKERSDEIPIYISKAEKLLDNIAVESTDNPSSIDMGKGNVFRFIVSYNGNSGKTPLGGVRVSFLIKNNEGDYSRTGVSETNGIVLCRINSLKEAKPGNIIRAVLSIDFSGIDSAALRDAMDRAAAHSEFRTFSLENMNIPVSVISGIPDLTAKVQDYLILKGYKVVKIPPDLTLESFSEENPESLKELSSVGIKRVMIIKFNAPDNAQYNKELDRYLGVYSLTAQLIDTSTGEILSSRNIKLSVTAASKGGIPGSFIKAAGKELKNLID